MTAEAYERSWQTGRAAVLAGTHDVDRPPSEGGRWGLSLVLRPAPVLGRQLAAMARELKELIDSCWAHDEDALHVTVRALERYRRHIPADDPSVAAYVDAMGEIAAVSGPVELRLAGLTLTPGGVLGCGMSDDGSADALREVTGKVLAARHLDWLEREFHRDMWHLTLAHFTGPIRCPEALLDWVAARRASDLGVLSAGVLHLVRAHHDGSTIRLTTLASAVLGTGQVTHAG